MIKELEISNIEGTPVKWLSKTKAFKDNNKWKFTPGLNILWGPNGSGKSTLLLLLARMFHCEQGCDEQKITSYSMSHLLDRFAKTSSYDSVKVEHDGSPVVYLDSGVTKGQIFPGTFDDDFFRESVSSYMSKGSSGEMTSLKLGNILKCIIGNKFKEADLRGPYGDEKSIIEGFFKGTFEKDRPTVLMDEPDRSLDITSQFLLWKFVMRNKHKAQFIIAAHNLLACDFEDANYITFGDSEYLQDCRMVKRNMNSPKDIDDYFADRLRKPKR
jgi:DNA polymerase III delta prime subunit